MKIKIAHIATFMLKYVSSSDQKAFAKDRKTIYTAINKEQALSHFIDVKNR